MLSSKPYLLFISFLPLALLALSANNIVHGCIASVLFVIWGVVAARSLFKEYSYRYTVELRLVDYMIYITVLFSILGVALHYFSFSLFAVFTLPVMSTVGLIALLMGIYQDIRIHYLVADSNSINRTVLSDDH